MSTTVTKVAIPPFHVYHSGKSIYTPFPRLPQWQKQVNLHTPLQWQKQADPLSCSVIVDSGEELVFSLYQACARRGRAGGMGHVSVCVRNFTCNIPHA